MMHHRYIENNMHMYIYIHLYMVKVYHIPEGKLTWMWTTHGFPSGKLSIIYKFIIHGGFATSM